MPPVGGFFACCSSFITHMKLSVPGTRVVFRLFERVETTNKSFAIFDIGVGYTDSDCVDSVAVGVASTLIHPDSDAERQAVKRAARNVVNTVAVAAPAVAVAVVAPPTIAATAVSVGTASVAMNELTKVR